MGIIKKLHALKNFKDSKDKKDSNNSREDDYTLLTKQPNLILHASLQVIKIHFSPVKIGYQVVQSCE
ncbi:MAG: hypothetical protein FMNOHCHN_00606 [Ignavibacteriaceae bacterium]|nr:hypothetical protein [Ignavibacteriaceae bacterium]